jgi:hypothetical protein
MASLPSDQRTSGARRPRSGRKEKGDENVEIGAVGDSDGPTTPGPVTLPIRLLPSSAAQVLAANQVVGNFTGTEFLITVIAAFPQPWRRDDELPTEVEGNVLARFAFSPSAWLSSVDALARQVERLRAAGVVPGVVPAGPQGEPA